VTAAANAVANGAGRVAAIDAELATARASLQAAQNRAGEAAEAYDGARVLLEQRTAEADSAAAAASAAREASEAATLALSRYAAEVFQGGGSVSQLDVFFSGSPQDTLDRAAGLEAVGDERARIMREADAARQLSQTLQQAATEALARQAAAAASAEQAAGAAQARSDEATAQATSLQVRQGQLVGELAVLRQTSVQLESDRQAGLAALEQARQEEENRRRAEAAQKAAAERAAAEQAAAAKAAAEQAAAERAAAARAAAARQPAAPAPAPPAARAAPAAPSAPAPAAAPKPAASPSGGVGAVLAFARAQMGEPYAWGAAGPSSWDCSGLTMMAWRQAGVSLAHYTGTQWAQTRHLPLAQAAPGDLVFFGSSVSTIHHVGLYIGGGQMINAPHTGDVVRVASIYSMGDLLPYVGRP